MWLVLIGLTSLIASLLFGRLLARAAAEQTRLPGQAGTGADAAVDEEIQNSRLAVTQAVRSKRVLEISAHRN